AKVARSVHLQALSLRLFALLAAVAGVLIVGQTIGRQVAIAGDDHPVLRGIGVTRAQLASLSLARAALAGLAGALLAVGVATALSPLAPIGLARLVDPTRGVRFDASLFAAVAVAIVALAVAMAAWPAWHG